ncbi:MAG: hypothetical protein FJW39_13960 [Acidobacteria bacterium]|nr:hypothetical protein [Acidobacteriota bacterium]
MPKMTLSHMEVSLVFAVVCSIVMGIVSKRTNIDRIQYGLYTFGCFIVALFGLGWLMYLGHG